MPTTFDASALKTFLLGLLNLSYPYTNDELHRMARSQGFKVRIRDIKATVNAIADDIRAGRIRRSEEGLLAFTQ